MKCALFTVLLAGATSGAALAASKEDPIKRVIGLLGELRTTVVQEGTEEQNSYSKYACWVEDTLSEKAKAISSTKEKIEDLNEAIKTGKGSIAATGADLSHLEDQIGEVTKQIKETEAQRDEAGKKYNADTKELAANTAALRDAITVLSKPHEKLLATSSKVLQNLQQAQVLDVMSGIRGVLKSALVLKSVSADDLELVRRFTDKPDLSATQISEPDYFSKKKPGQYNAGSGTILGILKTMLDEFVEESTTMETEHQTRMSAMNELLTTKQDEEAALTTTHDAKRRDMADAKVSLSANTEQRDLSKKELDADEQFFATTKAAGATKATQWAERSRLRSEELSAIDKAVEILKKHVGLLQLGTASFLQLTQGTKSLKAYGLLRSLASKYGSTELAKMAVDARGGWFDKVIASINAMLKVLDQEDADDISQRDQCQAAEMKLGHSSEDYDKAAEHAQNKINTMTTEKEGLGGDLTQCETDKTTQQGKITSLKDLRTQEHSDYLKAMQDSKDAVKAITEATEALKQFYQNNKIALGMAQRKAKVEPAPDTFQTGNYGGKQSESSGIISILTMLADDEKKSMEVATAADNKNQNDYIQDLDELQAGFQALENKCANLGQAIADLGVKLAEEGAKKKRQDGFLSMTQDEAKKVKENCAWVTTHFDDRRSKRKLERDGLVDAKNFLVGMES